MYDVTDNLELAKRLEATGYYKIVTTGDEGPNGEDWTSHELDYVQKEWVRFESEDCILIDFEIVRMLPAMSLFATRTYKRVIILHGMTDSELEIAEAMAGAWYCSVEFRKITSPKCFDGVPADADFHIHYDTVNNSDVLIDELDWADDFFNYFGG